MSKKNIASLVIKSITVVFLMFATAIASFAWFTNNQNVKNKDIQMGIHSEDATATFYVYKYDIESEIETVDVQTCVTTQNDVVPIILDFNQYDTVFVDRNKYTPIVIRVDVESENLHLGANETGSVSFTVIRNHNLREANKYYTSDILRFTTVTPRNIQTTGSQYDVDLYKGFIDDYYDDTKNATTVAAASLTNLSIIFSDDSTSGSYEEIVITSSYTNSDLVLLPGTGDEEDSYRLTVYLFLSYDETLINDYTENSIGFSSQELDFLNDLTLVNVKNDKQGGNS